MNNKILPMKHLFLTILLIMVSAFYSLKAQSIEARQVLSYYELKGLLSKHRETVESMLSLKRFRVASRKERPESTIFAYEKESDSTRILIRVRNRDGLVSEIAWDEKPATLGTITHDAVYDGFVPVAGNSRYYNRFQKMALLVNYALAHEDSTVPCVLKVAEIE